MPNQRKWCGFIEEKEKEKKTLLWLTFTQTAADKSMEKQYEDQKQVKHGGIKTRNLPLVPENLAHSSSYCCEPPFHNIAVFSCHRKQMRKSIEAVKPLLRFSGNKPQQNEY